MIYLENFEIVYKSIGSPDKYFICSPTLERRAKMGKNAVKRIRESLMMSKAELSRKANVSPITLSRIENGMSCRMETKRKILLALGYKLSDKNKLFKD
jgi:DNA-binding XRE family transcriptional regulator